MPAGQRPAVATVEDEFNEPGNLYAHQKEHRSTLPKSRLVSIPETGVPSKPLQSCTPTKPLTAENLRVKPTSDSGSHRTSSSSDSGYYSSSRPDTFEEITTKVPSHYGSALFPLHIDNPFRESPHLSREEEPKRGNGGPSPSAGALEPTLQQSLDSLERLSLNESRRPCDACRQAKRRCDGNLPCDQCDADRKDWACSYNVLAPRRQPSVIAESHVQPHSKKAYRVRPSSAGELTRTSDTSYRRGTFGDPIPYSANPPALANHPPPIGYSGPPVWSAPGLPTQVNHAAIPSPAGYRQPVGYYPLPIPHLHSPYHAHPAWQIPGGGPSTPMPSLPTQFPASRPIRSPGGGHPMPSLPTQVSASRPSPEKAPSSKAKSQRSNSEISSRRKTGRSQESVHESQTNDDNGIKTRKTTKASKSLAPSRSESSKTRSHGLDTADDHSSRVSDETTSSESSSFWLAEYADEVPKLDDSHPFIRLRLAALQRVMMGFRTWQKSEPPADADESQTEGKQAGDDDGGRRQSDQPASSQGNSSRKRSRQSTTSEKGKEKETNNEEEESLQSQKIPTKRRRTGSDRKLTFACPYTKKDPMHYRDCYKYMLTRIRDVKQHLVRCHRIPFYCPRCMGTFDTEEIRDEHIRAMSCPAKPVVKLDGVTEAHKLQLAKRPQANLSQEDQWFAVFDIMFPGHQPRPASPYIDTELLQDITLYQDFLMMHGPQILSEILTMRGAVTWNLPNEERDLAAFQQTILEDGLRVVFHRWASRNGLTVEDTSTTVSSNSGNAGQNTPSSSSASIVPGEALDHQVLPAVTEHVSTEEPALMNGTVGETSSELTHLGAGLESLDEFVNIDQDDLELGQGGLGFENDHGELMRLLFPTSSDPFPSVFG